MTREDLLKRLDEITQAAKQTRHALAVLGLGSAGIERNRMDRYSDLDVWIIVEDGYKQQYFADLSWLSASCPIAFKFKHSSSGYGLLFADGIFCELDIFESADLQTAGFAGAQIIWKAPDAPDAIGVAQRPLPPLESDYDRILDEALSNLYVGLGRFYRGEKLSGMRFIQVYAIDQLLKLVAATENTQSGSRDPFGNDRRFERRFPLAASELANMMQGYERTPESALAILNFLDKRFKVNQNIKQAILARLDEHRDKSR